ncbi:MAG: MFS transporter [Caldilineaceae bacterium]|nr:MFS transporter [Caldilineaceae bacterium]
MQKTNRRSMTILFLTMFIVMVGFGVIMPILPFYAENMGATASDLGLLFAAYSIVQFFFSPIWGQMSDRVGRKPMILLGLVGFALSFVLFGLANSLFMLFVARILGGILSAATLPTVMAYIADTTDAKARGGGMGVLGAAMGMGITFGPVIGGYLSEINPSLPFFFSAALALAVAVFAAFMLPESRSKADQLAARQNAQSRRGPLGNLADVWTALLGPIGFILLLAFLASFASANLEGTFALFSEQHLGFDESQMGLLFGIMGIIMALTQAFLVGPFINTWGEERMIKIGLVSSAIGFICLLFTYDMLSVAIVMGIMGVGNAALRPAVSSLASKRSPADQQGAVMGVVNSYNSLGRIFGPILGGFIFDLLGYQWPYIVGGVLFILIWMLSIVLFNRNQRAEELPLPIESAASAD